ncbi:hypothetical protein D3C72_2279050 [compost metagenome]
MRFDRFERKKTGGQQRLNHEKCAQQGAYQQGFLQFHRRLQFELRPDWRVIGRLFHAANVVIDAGFDATFCQRRAGQQQVDAQAAVVIKTF